MSFKSSGRSALLSFSAAALATAFWACTATNNSTTSSTSTSTSSSTSGGGSGGKSTTASSSSGIEVDAGDNDGGLDDGGICTGTTAKAELIPLDMVILLDESGSMDGIKWTTVTAALKTFISDPMSAGIGVGINFFPELPSVSSDDCIWQDYAMLRVPIAALPANQKPLTDAIDGEMPQGGTPSWGALKGALAAATAYQDAHPTHKVIVVFATDGDPTSCTIEDIPSIAALASSALNYDGVQTYVIGVPGATVPNLDAIAQAGGTKMSYDVTQNVNQFAQKMAEIRANALKCDFPIPPPPDGATLDPTKVNVIYTPGGGGKPKPLPNVSNLADCMGHPGWYYDNNLAPTEIILCPESCTKVQGDIKAEVNVQFGCKTMIH